VFRKIGAKASVDFAPSMEVFPPIALVPIPRKLKLEKRGRTDGEENYPTLEATGADELMVTAAIWDHKARVRSYELLAQAVG
jgi:hypothetical protein